MSDDTRKQEASAIVAEVQKLLESKQLSIYDAKHLLWMVKIFVSRQDGYADAERLKILQQQREYKVTHPDGQLRLASGFFELCEHSGCHIVKFTDSIPFSDFSQTLTCVDDFERLVADGRYRMSR